MEILVCWLCLTCGQVEVPAAGDRDRYRERMQELGLKTEPAELQAFLRALVPTADSRRQQIEWLQQLSADDFRTREAAERALAQAFFLPVELLEEGKRSADPEVRFRAARILSAGQQGETRAAVLSILNYLIARKPPGFAPVLVPLLPHWEERSLGILQEALQATATVADLPLLQKSLETTSPRPQAVICHVIATVQKEAAVPQLLTLLKSEAAIVRLAAAKALANLGRREALLPLAQLLTVDDVDLRRQAGEILTAVTQQKIPFAAYDTVERRAAGAAAWKLWLDEHAADCKLHFPLDLAAPFLGRTFISIYPSGCKELDADGNVLFEEKGFTYAWGCHATADGFRVIVDQRQQIVVEYDPSGKENWRSKPLGTPLSDCRRLPNEHFLLTFSGTKKIAEVDRDSNVVWSLDVEGRPTTINILKNGNYLVNLQDTKKVVEVDRSGKVHWELTGLDNVLTAQGLDNGHVLVCEMKLGIVREYDRLQKVVWSKEGFTNACQAQRLPNGNTLVSDAKGITEINPAGETVSHLETPRGRFWRY